MMTPSFEKDYKKIFTIVFVASGLFLSILITFLIYTETTYSNNSVLKQQAEYYLDTRKSSINNYIKEHYEVISSFSSNDFFYNYLEQSKYNDFQLFLRTIHSYNQNIKNIIYTSSTGEEKIKLKRYKQGSSFILNHEQDLNSLKNTELFKNIISLENGDIYLSNLNFNKDYEDKNSNKYELTIGYKIYEDFELIGVFILDIYLDNIFKQTVDNPNFNLYITDEKGCLYETNNKDINTSTLDECKKIDINVLDSRQLYKKNNHILTLYIENNTNSNSFFAKLNYTYILMFIVILIISYLLSSYLADIPRKLNDKIKEQKKLFVQQSKFAAMGEMISVISHQWRQPLNEITVIVDEIKLKHQYKVLTDEEMDYLTKEIYDSADYMSNTIEDFNNFFKPNKDKEEFEFKLLLDESMNLLKSRINKLDVNLKVELIPNDLKYVGFKNELKQVILNIINNSFDALDENKIENKNVKISVSKTTENIIISIEDNAGGIPDNILENIFNPYFSTKTEKNGTGLGLYISKVIIENNMNGKISVTSEQKNSEFKISLPLN